MVAYLWAWYCQLIETAAPTGMGPAAITYEQLRAWRALRRVRLSPFEIDCLFALDRQHLSIRSAAP